LARAGDLPNSNDEIALISSLLSIHSAGQKVARLIGQNVLSNWQVFNGGQYDLIFAPVGTTYAMLVIGKGLAAEDQALKTVDLFSLVRKNIEQILGESVRETSMTQEPITTPLDTTERSERDMEPLFKGAKKKFKSSEVNEFWNNAADKQKALSNPDMLSYEQAKQLGLAPKDES
jgi:hypothetical protein